MSTYRGEKLTTTFFKTKPDRWGYTEAGQLYKALRLHYSIQLKNGQWLFPAPEDLARLMEEHEKILDNSSKGKPFRKKWTKDGYIYPDPMQVKLFL